MRCFKISDYYDYNNPERYFALRSMLKASGFAIFRDDKIGGTWACLDSNDAESLFNNVLNEWRTKLSDYSPVEIISEEKNIDWEKVRDTVTQRFKHFPSQVPHVSEAINQLKAGNNVLLVGPPGSGKSLFMDILGEVLTAVYINMANASNAGIENVIPMLATADVVLIDELDKASTRDLGVILQLADSTRQLVVITKANKSFMVRLKVPIVASMNPATNKRAQNYWKALTDRFIVVEIPRPTDEELKLFIADTADTEDEEIINTVMKYADTLSLRKIVMIAKYIKTNRPTKEQLNNILKAQFI
jgi:adenylate kinase family enzyme